MYQPDWFLGWRTLIHVRVNALQAKCHNWVLRQVRRHVCAYVLLPLAIFMYIFIYTSARVVAPVSCEACLATFLFPECFEANHAFLFWSSDGRCAGVSLAARCNFAAGFTTTPSHRVEDFEQYQGTNSTAVPWMRHALSSGERALT